MIKKLWEEIKKEENIRQNLSKIRQEIKEQEKKVRFSYMVVGEEQILIELLQSEDAKTRKNVALLMGDLGEELFMMPIWTAYIEEPKRFVKSSYLSALSNFDYRELMESLKEQLVLARAEEVGIENEKHNREEIRELSALILKMEGAKHHKFVGRDQSFDLVLLTNRNHQEITKEELLSKVPEAKVKVIGPGLLASVPNLSWLREIRTWQEILFVVRGMETCEMDVEKIANLIVGETLFSFLEKGHEGAAPYYFRIELKSKKDLGQKSTFLKKLSSQIENISEQKLVNTTNNYEFELRIIENKTGNCNIMIKLFTLPDTRFTYRTEVTPTSIRPVNAALTVALAKEYMKEDAQVLDPFCGVGTMLIERHKSVRANTTYGIDVQGEAIEKARVNTETAKQIIHYVNRDFFQFKHDYLFDEIITDMPFKMGRITEEDIEDIYTRFFEYIPQHLKSGALLVLYTHDKDLLLKQTYRSKFTLVKAYEISKREGTHVLILRQGV